MTAYYLVCKWVYRSLLPFLFRSQIPISFLPTCVKNVILLLVFVYSSSDFPMEGKLPTHGIQIHPHNSVGCKWIRQWNRDAVEAQVSHTPRACHSALYIDVTKPKFLLVSVCPLYTRLYNQPHINNLHAMETLSSGQREKFNSSGWLLFSLKSKV